MRQSLFLSSTLATRVLNSFTDLTTSNVTGIHKVDDHFVLEDVDFFDARDRFDSQPLQGVLQHLNVYGTFLTQLSDRPNSLWTTFASVPCPSKATPKMHLAKRWTRVSLNRQHARKPICMCFFYMEEKILKDALP